MKLSFSLQIWIGLVDRYNYELFHKCLDDLALIGYDGVELAYPFVKEMFSEKPEELNRLLRMHGLEVSSTYVGIDFRTQESSERGEKLAKEYIDFYSQAGCQNFLLDAYLERPMVCSSQLAPSFGKVREYTKEQLYQAADITNRIAEYANRAGMQLSWHTHWATFFESQELFSVFWNRTDSNLVKMCPDVGQILLAGLDPVDIVKKYLNRITHYVHYKDIDINRSQRELWKGYSIPRDNGAYSVDSYGRWIELGRGDVDLKKINNILREIDFDGWIACDLDTTPYVPRDSAQACKDYINYALGVLGERDQRYLNKRNN